MRNDEETPPQADQPQQPQAPSAAPPAPRQQQASAEMVDVAQSYDQKDLSVTDVMGEPLPDDHPAMQNPQVGRPFSKGDNGVRWGDRDREEG